MEAWPGRTGGTCHPDSGSERPEVGVLGRMAPCSLLSFLGVHFSQETATPLCSEGQTGSGEAFPSHSGGLLPGATLG